MPTPKPLSKYDSEYFELFREAKKNGACTIPCTTSTEARALRYYLYSFRHALRSDDNVEHTGLRFIANSTTITQNGANITLTYQTNPFATQLRQRKVRI